MTPAPRTASEWREHFRRLRDRPNSQDRHELKNPPERPATRSTAASHTNAYPSTPQRHYGDARRQFPPHTACETQAQLVTVLETDKKELEPAPATCELRSETDKKGHENAVDTGRPAGECPLDDRVIYGLVLRAFAGERELEFVEVNRRCRSAGFPGGAQAVTLAIVSKYVGVRNGWNGLPYRAYLTGRMPIQ